MIVLYLRNFDEELSKIKDESIARSVFSIIQRVESSRGIKDFPDIEKIQNHPTAYKIKNENFLIGLFVEPTKIIFGAFIDLSH